jgi:hypothetical protein
LQEDVVECDINNLLPVSHLLRLTSLQQKGNALKRNIKLVLLVIAMSKPFSPYRNKKDEKNKNTGEIVVIL